MFDISFSSFALFKVKFMFSKKATKIDEIFTVHLTLCSKCQINGEDFVNLFMFSKKAIKMDEIFIVDLTLTTQCQIDREDFVNFCCLL